MHEKISSKYLRIISLAFIFANCKNNQIGSNMKDQSLLEEKNRITSLNQKSF